MIFLSRYELAAVGIAVLLMGALTGYFYWRYRVARESGLEDLVEEDGEIVFDPPDVKRTPMDYFRVMRHLQRQHKLAKKGYVKWYTLDSTLSRPRWVKPEREGSGTPKYTEDGEPYYFPKDAMVSDAITGAYVALHRDGEGDPINLRDPAYPGMETDLIERTINLEAEANPPGFLSNLGLPNLSTQAMLWGGIALLFVAYAAQQMYM